MLVCFVPPVSTHFCTQITTHTCVRVHMRTHPNEGYHFPLSQNQPTNVANQVFVGFFFPLYRGVLATFYSPKSGSRLGRVRPTKCLCAYLPASLRHTLLRILLHADRNTRLCACLHAYLCRVSILMAIRTSRNAGPLLFGVLHDVSGGSFKTVLKVYMGMAYIVVAYVVMAY